MRPDLCNFLVSSEWRHDFRHPYYILHNPLERRLHWYDYREQSIDSHCYKRLLIVLQTENLVSKNNIPKRVRTHLMHRFYIVHFALDKSYVKCLSLLSSIEILTRNLANWVFSIKIIVNDVSANFNPIVLKFLRSHFIFDIMSE